MAMPEIPNFFFFSVLSGIIVIVLIEVFRPEILRFKDDIRKNIKLDTNHGVSPSI